MFITYLLLAAAILIEAVATTMMKSTEGFTRWWPTALCLAGYGAAIFLLAQAVARGMQVGVAYAMWSAVGTTLVVIAGVFFLGEPISPIKVVGVALVIGGVVMLNLAGAH